VTRAQSREGEGGELPRPGEVIAGRYRVEHVLGEGGMGVVVAATQLQLDRQVAIKLRTGASTSDSLRERFVREARAAARLRSEHAVRVLDFGTTEDGAEFLVMERLEGEDLAAVVARGPLPLGDVVHFVLQACEALAEAHQAGIVHRDIKPANLFMTRRPDGRPCVKVLDFGISKLAEPARPTGGLTGTREFFGSPYYVSPEQIRRPKEVDARADIWALGVVLYELATARRPFEAEQGSELLARILMDAPAPLRGPGSTLPDAFEAIVSRCLAKNPDDRYPSLGELASALAALGDDEDRRSVSGILGTLGSSRTPPFGGAVSNPSPPASRDASPTIPQAPSTARLAPLEVTVESTVAPQPAPVAPRARIAPLPSDPADVVDPAYGLEGASTSSPFTRTDGSGSGSVRGIDASRKLGVGAAVVGVALVAMFVGRAVSKEPAPSESPSPTASASAAPSVARGSEAPPWVVISPPPGRRILGLPPAEHTGDRDDTALSTALEVAAPAAAFRIQRHEVTWREFDPWLDSFSGHDVDRSWLGDDRAARASLPASGMSWVAASAYCASIGARLPTEAEWEYAARGPELRKFPWGDGPATLDGVRAFLGPDARPEPVGTSSRDVVRWGKDTVHDLLGNVREWTATEWISGETGAKTIFKDYTYRAVRGFPLDRPLPPRDATACDGGNASACTPEVPSHGLAYRSNLCGEGSCLAADDAAGKRRLVLLRSIGFRCAKDGGS
jgi:serine/threonine protein kinase/formylglycine-generating enzyme required for sulfatase activity